MWDISVFMLGIMALLALLVAAGKLTDWLESLGFSSDAATILYILVGILVFAVLFGPNY